MRVAECYPLNGIGVSEPIKNKLIKGEKVFVKDLKKYKRGANRKLCLTNHGSGRHRQEFY